MITKHTPGPWVEHKRDGIPAVGIDVGDGGDLLPIVDVVRGKTKAEAKKNRRLIAAAPRMSAVLKRAAHLLAELPSSQQTPQLLAMRTEIVETIKQSTPEHYGLN